MSYDELIEFVTEMNLPEDDLGDEALVMHLRRMRDLDLPKPEVVIFNPSNAARTVGWEEFLPYSEDRSFLRSSHEIGPDMTVRLAKRRMIREADSGMYKVRSVHLGNPDDEKLFLPPVARQKVVDELSPKKPVSFDYLCSEYRDRPGLLIYLFGIGIGPETSLSKFTESDSIELGHGRCPTVGYSVSFPRSEQLKGKSKKEIDEIVRETKRSYKVSLVYSRNRELGAYQEEFEDDE